MSEQPPTDPWQDPVRPVEPAQLPSPTAPPLWGQTILPGELLGAGPAPGRQRRAKSGLVIGAIATVVAVAAGVGAYAAMSLSGGGRQPESLAPATSFAFAKLDLDPAASQKLAVRNLAKKFPEAPQGELEEVFDEFLRTALQGDDEVDFNRDIDPWLGQRIGIAGFVGPSGAPKVLGIIASKDDEKARPALARIAAADDGDTAYLLRDGYVLVAPEQGSLDAAVAGIEAGTLAESDHYAGDVDALSGDQILTAWTDVEAAFEAAEHELGSDAPAIPAELRKRLKGRVALGIHATSDYVEMEGVATDADTASLTSGRPTLITGLPENTVAAISAGGVGKAIDEALDAFGSFPGLPTRADLTEEIRSSVGLDLDADLLPLFGDQLVLALGGVPDLSGEKIPDLALLSIVSDPARAAKVASKIQDLAAQEGAPLQSQVVGNTFFVTTGSAYLGRLTKGGPSLADTPRFRRAVGELDDDVSFVAYADLHELLQLIEDRDDYARVAALAAVGVRAGTKDGRGYLRLRVTVE